MAQGVERTCKHLQTLPANPIFKNYFKKNTSLNEGTFCSGIDTLNDEKKLLETFDPVLLNWMTRAVEHDKSVQVAVYLPS